MSEHSEMIHPCRQWFAVWTRSRQEKASFAALRALSISSFLPLSEQSRQWSDRVQRVQVPLFSGYLFVHIESLGPDHLKVLKVPGVVGFVGNLSGPIPIPERQIEDVRQLLRSKADCTIHPAIREGVMVRVTSGPLTGLEGRLVRMNSRFRLAISIDLVQRSLLVEVSRNDVRPLDVYAA